MTVELMILMRPPNKSNEKIIWGYPPSTMLVKVILILQFLFILVTGVGFVFIFARETNTPIYPIKLYDVVSLYLYIYIHIHMCVYIRTGTFVCDGLQPPIRQQCARKVQLGNIEIQYFGKSFLFKHQDCSWLPCPSFCNKSYLGLPGMSHFSQKGS